LKRSVDTNQTLAKIGGGEHWFALSRIAKTVCKETGNLSFEYCATGDNVGECPDLRRRDSTEFAGQNKFRLAGNDSQKSLQVMDGHCKAGDTRIANSCNLLVCG
jgi:hypothetical protein